jgi:hypothetical protein
MRRVSMATRDELVGAVRQRYIEGGRAEKARILDEFVAVSGFHRKHAMQLLATVRRRLVRDLDLSVVFTMMPFVKR